MDNIDEDTLDELVKPIKAVEEKWKLLPHFLRMRGLMRQHIDSFDNFLNVEIKNIVAARSNQEVRSDADPKFFLRYTDIYVGEPNVEEESFVTSNVTPFQCRLRDCTYSAPIFVNVRYTRQRQIVTRNGVQIGRMPIMLRSEKCVLRNKSDEQLANLKECAYDPGGYFIIRGTEKVLLMQEQLSKNNVAAQITSSTHDRNAGKDVKVYLKHNSLGDDIPIVVILKAMGLESDQEIVQLVGAEEEMTDLFAGSLEEPYTLGVYTQAQALSYIGNKVRQMNANAGDNGRAPSFRRHLSPEAEATEMLAHVVLNHVPVENYCFRSK
eukprot:gene9010-18650_t